MNLGPASLTITNLDRSVAFYQDVIGLQVHRHSDTGAVLGAGAADLLELVEDAAARPAGRHAGLYHLALLYESREELARAVQRLVVTRTPIDGASDHGVSERSTRPTPTATASSCTRPSRDQWPAPGARRADQHVHPAARPPRALRARRHDEPVRHASPGLRVGRVHLHVSDLEAAVAHYQEAHGLELMVRMPSAAFLSWDGYHHHLGLNTWRGVGIPPVPADAVGLRHFSIVDPAASRARSPTRRATGCWFRPRRRPASPPAAPPPRGG